VKPVAVVAGSSSDLPRVQPALDCLDDFGVPYEFRILSAHRTPGALEAWVASLEGRGFGAVIAAAGWSAHLAGAVAARTVLPVIALPLSGGFLQGLEALLSMVQMPPGVPVATVGVDGAKNAALLAVEILAVEDVQLRERLWRFREEQRQAVLGTDTELGRKI
jgi:5-(carboxyamino)imidazole ribonucleotide mutase